MRVDLCNTTLTLLNLPIIPETCGNCPFSHHLCQPNHGKTRTITIKPPLQISKIEFIPLTPYPELETAQRNLLHVLIEEAGLNCANSILLNSLRK